MRDVFRRVAKRLANTQEGLILAWGLVLFGLVLAELGVLLIVDDAIGWAVLQGMLTEIFTGREGGVPVALTGGAPPWLVAQVSATQDLAWAALAYPVFLALLHQYHDKDNWFMRRLRRIEDAARRHGPYVHRWGPVGVFLFMLIPFLVNGPLLGAVLGRLAGIPTRRLLLPVVAATVVAAFAWSYFFEVLFDLVSHLDPRLPLALTIGILAIIVIGTMAAELREAVRKKG